MLDLEVSPEEGLQHDNWEFLLGMHFSQAVAIVQSQVRIIKSAHVIYNDQSPLAHDLILDLPQDGFRLIFDSNTQRLKLIEIYNMKLVRLKYCGTVFNGAEVIPTVHQIDRCFGATRPGTFDKERQLFALNFRGLSFYFPVDFQFEPHYSHGLGSLRFPGEATPILSRLVVYSGNNPTEGPVPALPPSLFRGSVFCEECSVIRNSSETRTLGLRLKLYSHSTDFLDPDPIPVTFEREIHFGDSAESIAGKLGSPMKIYYKSDDKMKIHSKEAHKKVTNDKSDYFFNYFTIGIDVLFDATCNRVIKFILHTNFPGHYDFTDYHRCPFTLTLGRSERPSLFEISSSTTGESCVIDKVSSSMASTHISTTNTSNSSNTNPNPLQNLCSSNTNPVPATKSNNNKNRKKNNGNNNNNNNNGKGKNQNSDSKTSNSPPSESLLVDVDSAVSTRPIDPTMSKLSTTQHSMENVRSISIKWDTRWEHVRHFLCQDKAERSRLERPVVLTRSSASNPFGPSLCYGVQDMIFEVMSNDHLASVSLYFYREELPA